MFVRRCTDAGVGTLRDDWCDHSERAEGEAKTRDAWAECPRSPHPTPRQPDSLVPTLGHGALVARAVASLAAVPAVRAAEVRHPAALVHRVFRPLGPGALLREDAHVAPALDAGRTCGQRETRRPQLGHPNLIHQLRFRKREPQPVSTTSLQPHCSPPDTAQQPVYQFDECVDAVDARAAPRRGVRLSGVDRLRQQAELWCKGPTDPLQVLRLHCVWPERPLRQLEKPVRPDLESRRGQRRQRLLVPGLLGGARRGDRPLRHLWHLPVLRQL